MKVISVTCNNCGGPLEIPRKVKFFTCGYCSSQLEIRQSGNAVYSEVLKRLEDRTEQLANDVETIKAQNEIEQIDREWRMGLDRYKTRSRDGEYNVPSAGGSIVGGVIAIGFGIFWMAGASNAGAPPLFVMFGLLFIGMAVYGMINGAAKASNYERDHAAYQTKRQELMQRGNGQQAPKD